MSSVLVCGLGQLGFRVASLLLNLGESVTVLTTEAKPDWRRALERAGARIVIGDAESIHTLREAGVDEAKALIGCCSVDLTNIQIAFEARRANPDLRIVLRLFDQNLARHAVAKMGVEAALGMAALSAPAFAASALGEDLVSALELEGERCVVARATVEKGSPLEGLTAQELEERYSVEVLTWYRGEGLEILPGSEIVLHSGDCVKLLGMDDAYERIFKVEDPAETVPHHTLMHWLTALSPIPIGKFLWRLWQGTSRELRAVFISMIVLVIVSFFVVDRYMVEASGSGKHLNALDAFYYVITTITTTGYGDITVKGQGWLELYGIFLMLLGSFIFAALYSLITDYLVNARLQQLLGTKRVPEKGHVILVGLGIVGYRVLEELNRRETEVVVIEQNPSAKFLGSARARASVLIGDARDEETLNAAGVSTAKAIIACTGDDAMNLSVGLAAASLSDKPRRVLRIFDADLAVKVQEAFDIDFAMSASRLAAPHFVANALFGRCAGAFTARGRLFAIGVAMPPEEIEGCEYNSSINLRLGKNMKRVHLCVKRMDEDADADTGREPWREESLAAIAVPQNA